MTGPGLARWMAGCARRPLPVLAAMLALGLACAWLASARLGVSTDTSGLFSASLPWRQRGLVLQRAFPQGEDLLVAAIDGRTPEEADATAAGLLAALRADPAHFRDARRPDDSPYLERNGLMFLDPAPLGALLDQTIDAQPFLGQLAADPSLRGLAGALGLIARGVEAGQADLRAFEPSLRQFHGSLAAAAAGRPEPMSWETLLAGPVAELGGRFRFVLAKPVLDYGALEPGEAASDALRRAAAGLEFVRDGRARVRLTGSVALEDEEFATVADGALAGVGISLAALAALVLAAVRSWRLAVVVLGTLLWGLLLTTGFAALAVGTLNLVSVAFAVLFMGIAVDFSIQVAVRFREALGEEGGTAAAAGRTGRAAGGQVLVAALASTAGFLAFTPTSFRGVAQLGLIAGVGMLIAFACTVTLLPALLAVLGPHRPGREAGVAALRRTGAAVGRHPWPVVAAFAAAAALGLALLPRLGFDSDPLHTKKSDTEAMRTLYDLMDDPVANPYTIEILMPSLDAARAMAARLARLPSVDSVLDLDSFVPEDQAAKLPLLADAAGMLRTTLSAVPEARPTAAELRMAVRAAGQELEALGPKLPADSPVHAIAGDLVRLGAAPDAVLEGADRALTRFLPLQLDRLRTALGAGTVGVADVPEDLRRDWLLPDGRAKLQVVPKRDARDSAGLHRFVAEVEAVEPDAAGSAVTITGSADAITSAFRTAAVLALCAVALLLAAALRRLADVALVLAPLLVSALLTVAGAVLLPLPLNFANVIALPLLLGVGVSFNVYFVMNRRAGAGPPLAGATARGVLFSALTTAAAFGVLALSRHPGTASMGALLLLSLGCTVVTTLLFVPALLAVAGRAVARRA